MRTHKVPDFIPPTCLAMRLCCSSRGLGTLSGQERLPLVPDNLCVVCFLEGTSLPLQCARLSECPTLLAEHV